MNNDIESTQNLEKQAKIIKDSFGSFCPLPNIRCRECIICIKLKEREDIYSICCGSLRKEISLEYLKELRLNKLNNILNEYM